MAITEVGYGFTFNRGNFQSERIDARATVGADDSPEAVMWDCRAFVYQEAGDPTYAKLCREQAAKVRARLIENGKPAA